MTPPGGSGAGGVLGGFGPRSWAEASCVSFGRLGVSSYFEGRDRVELDGTWSFALFERPEAVELHPTGAEGNETIEVPGCWTMQGFDVPQYTNTAMPFAGPFPAVPEDNPTGVYRREVELPAAWAGRRIVLQVGGAESVLYVHVDGAPVGMGKDSRLPQEFDLTGLVTPGRSFELALTVVRWSDATYLEDQDHWFHAGLHRSVFVYSTPPVYLKDVRAVADYDPGTGDGRLELEVLVDGPGYEARGHVVSVEACGKSARAPVRVEHPVRQDVNVALLERRGCSLVIDCGPVEPWSAELPSLERVQVRLLAPEGDEVDAVALEVGFRRVEVRGAELLVNGRPVLLKGVNRHDHDPRRGKAVTRASMAEDVRLMKAHNLNAVRTSHYPSDAYFYELCDRIGLYVVDEANLESHAYLRSLSKDPRLAPAILSRVSRMALRDKNHPSVICWSLGNESGVSPAIEAAAAWLRAYDPTRPICYESGLTEDAYAAMVAGEEPDLVELWSRPRTETDLVVPMYPPVEALRAYAASDPERPLVMCEYAHAMNNSCGGLDEYWAAIREGEGLQGGFVWDWADQALVQAQPGGERLAYGGDFGDEPNDGAFCLNGLVSADRVPHPSLLELRKVVQPVQLRPLAVGLDAVSFQVRNEYSFSNLSFLRPRLALAVDGDVVATRLLEPLELAPGAVTELRIDLSGLVSSRTLRAGQVADLTVSFLDGEHEVAFEQVRLASRPYERLEPLFPATAPFDPRLTLWRAPIDNEVFGTGHASRWRALGLESNTAGVELHTEAVAVEGGVLVTHEVEIPGALDDLPRVGVRLSVGTGAVSVDWRGRGPHECYTDREASARFGHYETPVESWRVPYVHPQASGNRTGVRSLAVLDGAGRPLAAFDRLSDLQVTVSKVTDEQLADARHLEELSESEECYVWIDAAHRGVGSGAVGPDTAPSHRVGPGRYRWSYRVVSSDREPIDCIP